MKSIEIVLIVAYSLVALLTWCGVVYSIWNLCHFDRFDKSPKIFLPQKNKVKKIKKQLESQDNIISNIESNCSKGLTCKCELQHKIDNLEEVVDDYFKMIKEYKMEIRRLNRVIEARQDSENKWFVQSIEAQTQIDMLQEEVKELENKLNEKRE